MRISTSRATGYSPYEVVYGFKATLPGFPEYPMANLDWESVTPREVIEHVQELEDWRKRDPISPALDEMREEI